MEFRYCTTGTCSHRRSHHNSNNNNKKKRKRRKKKHTLVNRRAVGDRKSPYPRSFLLVGCISFPVLCAFVCHIMNNLFRPFRRNHDTPSNNVSRGDYEDIDLPPSPSSQTTANATPNRHHHSHQGSNEQNNTNDAGQDFAFPRLFTMFENMRDAVFESDMAAAIQASLRDQSAGRSTAAAAPPASVQSIRQLPTVTVRREDLIDAANRECCVCLEPVELGKVVIRLPCAHIFHRTCILQWLQTHCTCPVCRYELPTDCEEFEKGREQRMRDRKPRYAVHELERLTVRQLLAMIPARHQQYGQFAEKRDLIDALVKSGTIEVVPTPPPLQYRWSELQGMSISQLKAVMNDEAGVFFDSTEVVEKNDMLQIFAGSGRLQILPEGRNGAIEAQTNESFAFAYAEPDDQEPSSIHVETVEETDSNTAFDQRNDYTLLMEEDENYQRSFSADQENGRNLESMTPVPTTTPAAAPSLIRVETVIDAESATESDQRNDCTLLMEEDENFQRSYSTDHDNGSNLDRMGPSLTTMGVPNELTDVEDCTVDRGCDGASSGEDVNSNNSPQRDGIDGTGSNDFNVSLGSRVNPGQWTGLNAKPTSDNTVVPCRPPRTINDRSRHDEIIDHDHFDIPTYLPFDDATPSIPVHSPDSYDFIEGGEGFSNDLLGGEPHPPPSGEINYRDSRAVATGYRGARIDFPMEIEADDDNFIRRDEKETQKEQVTEPLDSSSIRSKSISQLRSIARQNDIDLRGCYEKSEIVDRLEQNGLHDPWTCAEWLDVSEIRTLASLSQVDLFDCRCRMDMIEKLRQVSMHRPEVAHYFRTLAPLARLSVSQLRSIARERQLNVSDCLEKGDLMQQLIAHARP